MVFQEEQPEIRLTEKTKKREVEVEWLQVMEVVRSHLVKNGEML